MNIQRIEYTSDSVVVYWEDGAKAALDSLWLYHNHPEHWDRRSGQRLVDIPDLPETLPIDSAHVSEKTDLIVLWNGDHCPAHFSGEWLRQHRPESAEDDPIPTPSLWQASEASCFAHQNWAQFIESREARRRWLCGFVEHGLAFLHGVPAIKNMVADVAHHFGHVRETNSGRVFDVRVMATVDHLANSDMGLPLHTDNPYREPVPGMQLLHILKQSRDGGGSLFADGFAAAERLRAAAPEAFHILSTTVVCFRYRNATDELVAYRPIIQTTCEGDVLAVHLNNRSLQPLRLSPVQTRAFYRAYRAFTTILNSQEFLYSVKMASGDIVAFDNQRIVHGRASFEGNASERHLQGCYLDKDGVYSVLRVLSREADNRIWK